MSQRNSTASPNISLKISQLDRRGFLVTGGAATAAVALGVGCARQINQGTFPVGEPSGMSVGSLRLVEDGPFIIARDEGGLYAMSALCTHLSCTVRVEGEQLPCPCHGSVFDANGQVVEGPARSPLEHYRVTIEDGAVTVDTTQVVPATTRAPVEG